MVAKRAAWMMSLLSALAVVPPAQGDDAHGHEAQDDEVQAHEAQGHEAKDHEAKGDDALRDEAPETLACARCKPAQAVWPWKANSYVLGTTEDGAVEAGAGAAEALACKKAFRYIDGSDLTCRIGCEATGEESRGCEKTKKPACMHGSYERDPSMWMFVCRKFKEATGVEACSREGAAAEPYWSMCEVHVKAERRRPCDCVE